MCLLLSWYDSEATKLARRFDVPVTNWIHMMLVEPISDGGTTLPQ
jgi:hypothetical protein